MFIFSYPSLRCPFLLSILFIKATTSWLADGGLALALNNSSVPVLMFRWSEWSDCVSHRNIRETFCALYIYISLSYLITLLFMWFVRHAEKWGSVISFLTFSSLTLLPPCRKLIIIIFCYSKLLYCSTSCFVYLIYKPSLDALTSNECQFIFSLF